MQAADGVIEVLPIGTAVSFEPDGKANANQGIVTAIRIDQGDAVMYQVAWWGGATRHSEWLQSFEVEPIKKCEPTRIGFKQ